MRTNRILASVGASLLALSVSALSASAETVETNFSVTNDSKLTQTYVMYVPHQLASHIERDTMMRGSISASVIDADGSGAARLSATREEPIYQAFIDPTRIPPGRDETRRTLLDPGFSLDAIASRNGDSAKHSDAFENELGPMAWNTIAIKLRFELSPGDSAEIIAKFEIAPALTRTEEKPLPEKPAIEGREAPSDKLGLDGRDLIGDLLAIMANFGRCAEEDPAKACDGDFNGDRSIDELDLIEALLPRR